MRLAAIISNETEKLAVCSSAGLVPMDVINEKQGNDWPDSMDAIIKEGRLEQLNEWYRSGGQREVEGLKDVTLAEGSFRYAPLYRTPPKIWGIGLNYAAHATDLSEKAPTDSPASFMKSTTSLN